MIRVKREYQSWVANETLEDYALRYAARGYRRWSPFVLANTAIGGISFLALEAIGASITISFGVQNAIPAIVLVSLLIFLVNLPIAYYSSTANVDIDLLTRGAGFGYIGSTLTSLVYASFTFIFFALEAAIMAQALELVTGLDLTLGYLLSSLVIIPIVFFGVTLINRLQMWTQPVWLVLLVVPFLVVLHKDPGLVDTWLAYRGQSDGQFDFLMFGAATSVLLSLTVQIGEQADYLRFLPDRTRENRVSWWAALIGAGPGWIVLGGAKVLGGSLLAVLCLSLGAAPTEAVAPIHMFITAYGFVFDDPAVVLAVALVFVVVSQIKINVTNAYAGSLAWSNSFARLAQYHPGRVVWLVFNVLIALLLTLMGILDTLETVLTVYSNIATAWLGALLADLVVLKPLGISPRYIEFKRAYLYNFNPVGCGAMLIASLLSILAYAGFMGPLLQAYSALFALALAFVLAIAIALLTDGRYYLARMPPALAQAAEGSEASPSDRCCVCERSYELRDMAVCTFYEGPICSLCCGLEAHCHDHCKVTSEASTASPEREQSPSARFAPHFGQRLGRFFALFGIVAAAMAAVMLLSYRLFDLQDPRFADELASLLTRIYLALLILIAIGAWWIVLSQESRELTEGELIESMHHLEQTRSELVESAKMASLGELVAGVAHEINTPVGIAVSAASYLHDRTEEVRDKLGHVAQEDSELKAFIDDASTSSRLLLSNARRAAQLVESFKRVAVDQSTDQRRRFDLASYLAETLANLRPQFQGSAIRIELDCAPDIDMDSYPGPLAQVVTNLVFNAIESGFEPGQAGVIRITGQAQGPDEVVIRCADNGRGIPVPLLERIFEPFFTTRRNAGGSGLGLHLVYNIVTHKLNGTINVANDAQGGAVFTIHVPRRPHESRSLADAMRIPQGGKSHGSPKFGA